MGFKPAGDDFDGDAFMARVEDRMRRWNYRQIPTLAADGSYKTAAPEPFNRWLMPCVWEDVYGNAHFDIAKLLRIFELPNSEANRTQCAQYLLRAMGEAGFDTTKVKVRTDADVGT